MKILCKCGQTMFLDDMHPRVHPISRDFCEKCGVLIYECCCHGKIVLNVLSSHKHKE